MAVTRIHLLNIPIDVLPEEDIEKTVVELLEKDTPQHILFFSIWDVLKARRNAEYRAIAENAALCLPISKSLLRAARFLKLPIPIRRDPFNVVIRILSSIDAHYKSVYLLGGHPQHLADAEANVRTTFPHAQIVGRFNGFYHKNLERDILLSIVKAHPSVVIAGSGLPGGVRWIHRHRAQLPASIFIYNKDIIDIFAKRKKRISDAAFRKGHEFMPQLLKNPLKILYIFRYFWFLLVVLFYRIFR